MSKTTWYQHARLRAIESVAFWQGRINTSDIMAIFGVSRVIAQGDIHRYIDKVAGNLIYNRKNKAYFVTPEFNRTITLGKLDEFSQFDQSSIDYVDKPSFTIDPEITRPLIQAIKNNKAICIEYFSMSTPSGTKRYLLPHTLVYSGFRWHVRAWCNNKREFRDFNVNRISKAYLSDIEAPNESHRDFDISWTSIINIELIANPKLKPDERKLIEFEFKMKNSQLTLPVRGALVMYTLQAYQVNLSRNESTNPLEQRLILKNKEEISVFLWNK